MGFSPRSAPDHWADDEGDDGDEDDEDEDEEGFEETFLGADAATDAAVHWAREAGTEPVADWGKAGTRRPESASIRGSS